MTNSGDREDRLDRLEALAENILAIVQVQQVEISDMKDLIGESIQDTVSMVGTLATEIQSTQNSIAEYIRQADVDRRQAAVDRAQAAADRVQGEVDRQEFRSYMRGLQTENNRILRTLEQFLELQRQQRNGDS